MNRLFVFFLMLIGSTNSIAENVFTSTPVAIKDLTFYSNVEPLNPGWAGFAQIRFESTLPWGLPNECHDTLVAIRKEDGHLISMALAASASNKPLKVFGDTIQKIGGNICILRALQVE